MDHIEQIWRNAVEIYRQIDEFRLRFDVNESSERVKTACFVSKAFEFKYSVDLLLFEIGRQWTERSSGAAIPDPFYAICYFSDDLNALVNKHGEFRSEIARASILASIYSENSWVLTSDDWTRDKGFVQAMHETDEWAWREFRPLKSWEFERQLNRKKFEIHQDKSPC